MEAKTVFINLATKDLEKSKAFYTGIGFKFVQEYSDKEVHCYTASEQIIIMMMNHERFKGFTRNELVDSKKSNEVIVALQLSSKEEVDMVAIKALKFGGSSLGEVVDHDFMYYRSFKDPDGHILEVLYIK